MRTKSRTREEFARLMESASHIRGSGFDALSDHVIITDDDGVILYANAASERASGYSRAEMIGKTPGELWGNQMEKDFYRRMWHTIKEEKKPFSAVVKNKHKNGTVYSAELRIYPIFDHANTILFFVAIEPDVSSRAAVEEHKNDFLSVVAHQLKSPLAASRLFLGALEAHSSSLSKKQIGIIRKLKETNQHLADLMQELLTIAELDKSDVATRGARESFADLVHSIIREAEVFAKDKRIRISFNASGDSPVQFQPNIVSQILKNIIINAVEYSRPGGVIDISLRSGGSEMLFVCRDTGIGIPQPEQHKIFTPFFRASNGVSYKPGTGLGLFIAKKFADAAGYRLWFQSEEGKGTVFYLAVPEGK